MTNPTPTIAHSIYALSQTRRQQALERAEHESVKVDIYKDEESGMPIKTIYTFKDNSKLAFENFCRMTLVNNWVPSEC